jgi:hypothetical protein
MDIFLPKGFEASRARAPMSRPARAQRLSVEADGIYYPVLRRWTTGFAVAAGDVPTLDGVVNLYEGATLLHECLILGKEEAGEDVIFKVKQAAHFDYAVSTQFDEDAQVSP